MNDVLKELELSVYCMHGRCNKLRTHYVYRYNLNNLNNFTKESINTCDEHEKWGISMLRKLDLAPYPGPTLHITLEKEDSDDTTIYEV